MSKASPASQNLDRLHLPYRVFEHAQPPGSLEEAARQRGQEPAQVIRSIVFRLGEGQFVLVLIAGPGQISWKRVRAHLGVSRISMASEEEILAATGYIRGAVTPLGLPRPLRILVDASVFGQEEVSIGSGIRGVAIVMKSKDLRQALGTAETGIFA